VILYLIFIDGARKGERAEIEAVDQLTRLYTSIFECRNSLCPSEIKNPQPSIRVRKNSFHEESSDSAVTKTSASSSFSSSSLPLPISPSSTLSTTFPSSTSAEATLFTPQSFGLYLNPGGAVPVATGQHGWKSALADFLHHSAPRRANIFYEVDCETISGSPRCLLIQKSLYLSVM
jgi:hypothetical protein